MEEAHVDEAEFQANVARLLELRELEQQIAAEQKEIREEIGRYLEARALKGWNGQVLGQQVRVVRQERSQVTYNEALLQQRLGERYRSLLSLDRKEMTKREAEVMAWLGDHALEVARVDRNKVKTAMESGEVKPEEFKGAFERTVTYTVALTLGTQPDRGRETPE